LLKQSPKNTKKKINSDEILLPRPMKCKTEYKPNTFNMHDNPFSNKILINNSSPTYEWSYINVTWSFEEFSSSCKCRL